jgi:light-regulated signal transduction histidine kinase (bacteriophytochrome)
MQSGSATRLRDESPVDPQSYASAILNILADSAEEKAQLTQTQRAILNLLEDAADEKRREDGTQQAVLNILEDVAGEQTRLEATQKAILNILEDSEEEKARVINVELRRANTAAEAANRELEAFSYSVAHDLRAPLRSIDGFSAALLEDCADKLDEDGKVYLGYVRQSAQLMAKLIEDLLSLSGMNRHELRRSPIDLAAIARTVLARLQRDQPDRTVELVVGEEIPADGDADLLAIVLENLLGNAWKFTGKCPHACIEFGQSAKAGGAVYFVRDNGAGFDMTYVDKLFGVFQRLHSASEFEGTGIGLSIVNRIIRRHGGRVWAEGEVGRGAIFYFTLAEGI